MTTHSAFEASIAIDGEAASPRSECRLARIKAYLEPRARTWAFMIPLRMTAFAVLC